MPRPAPHTGALQCGAPSGWWESSGPRALEGLWAGGALTPEPSSLGLSSRGVCVRHGGPPVLPFHPSLSRPWHPGTCQWDPALSTVSSMSPESFVSGVVRAHLRARACAWGTRVLSRVRAVWADEGWPVFTLSVFLLVFFYSLLILIALCHQPKLSSLRSARRLVLFTSYPSTVHTSMGCSRQ